MRTMTRPLLLLCACASLACKDKAWSFGKDQKGSVILAHQKGQISPLKKVTEITFKVPPCMAVEYVHVAVYNILDATPDITVNGNTNTVIISYEVLQPSESTYEVIIKGQLIVGCNSGDGICIENHRQKQEQRKITPTGANFHTYYYTNGNRLVGTWAKDKGSRVINGGVYSDLNAGLNNGLRSDVNDGRTDGMTDGSSYYYTGKGTDSGIDDRKYTYYWR